MLDGISDPYVVEYYSSIECALVLICKDEFENSDSRSRRWDGKVSKNCQSFLKNKKKTDILIKNFISIIFKCWNQEINDNCKTLI